LGPVLVVHATLYYDLRFRTFFLSSFIVWWRRLLSREGFSNSRNVTSLIFTADKAFTDNRGEAATLSGNGIGTVSSPRCLNLGAANSLNGQVCIRIEFEVTRDNTTSPKEPSIVVALVVS
jgi:hypothetical protein